MKLGLPSVLLLPLLAAAPAWAQTDGTLHILRPIIRSEQERPELCLEFDHNLESDIGKVQSSVKLEADGKSVNLAPQNISVAATMLCISSLDYRREYRLIATGLRGEAGEKQTENYRFSFTVPDKHPILSFAAEQSKDGMTVWHDNDPLLRSVNVSHAKIELYRITDPAHIAEAWRQRSQIMLAPSESAYFARHNGQLLWQSDIVLDDASNKTLEQKLPLHAALNGNVTPGLYFVVVSAPASKKETPDNELAPLAASWLLRSDLDIRGLRGADRFFALTDQGSTSTPLKDVHVVLEDANQQSLAEGKSDADGVTVLVPEAAKMSDGITLFGTTPAGDIAFADLSQRSGVALTVPGLQAAVSTDKSFYHPGGTAELVLTARDIHNKDAIPANTHLSLLRPDRSLYSDMPVGKNQNGAAQVHMPVPVGNGLWILSWQRADGTTLAEGNLRITSNEDAPKLEMSSDRPMLATDGGIDLTLKSTTKDGKAAPYVAGHLTLDWSAPDHIFPGWDGYHFGNGGKDSDTAPVTLAAFVTDDKGAAQLHINLPQPPGNDPMRAALLNAVTDPAAGVADPVPLKLPLRPKDFIIGVKPAATDGKFLENSVAHFDVIALDSEGKRRAMDGLSYRIYEEGRSFDWYQADGKWDYKPQPQQRRIAGGALNIKSDDPASIDWRGAAGTYHIDITDSSGNVLARTNFSAGWGDTALSGSSSAPLPLTASASTLKLGDTAKVRFKLDQPTMITAVIADDHIRKVIHQMREAGDNDIAVTPESDWGGAVKVTIDTGSASGQITLPLSIPQAKLETLQAPNALPPLDISTATLPALKSGDQAQLSVAITNNSASGQYHYAFTAPADLKIAGTLNGNINLNAGQTRTLDINLNPLQPGVKDLKVEISGPRNLKISHSWPIAISVTTDGFDDAPEITIKSQQSWPDAKNAKADSYAFIAPRPLYDAPQILAALLQDHAFTTREIAEEMTVLRLWHDVIVQSDLLPEQNLALRQKNLALRLVARQKEDGGFPAMPGGETDTISTTAAVAALSAADQSVVKPAFDAATNWVKRKLDNNWFEETERAERAAAYAAMAEAGRLDNASLHHFSDTSAGKNLPALAAAQIAYAFSRINDMDKAGYWLSETHITRTSPDLDPALLPLLAENQAFNADDLLAALGKIGGKKASADTAATFLRAMWDFQMHAGVWHAAIGNGEQNLHGVFAVHAPVTVHNAANSDLYLTEAHPVKLSTHDDSLSRHIYRMSGSELQSGEALNFGETYLVVDEGSWNEDGISVVRDVASPALTPVSCTLSNDLDAGEQLGWIKSLGLIKPTACEKAGAGIDALLPEKTGEAQSWRIAYLAKAEWHGHFTIAPVRIRALAGRRQTRQGSGDQLRVQ
ncbi:MAG TPA: hypothetical protein VFR09_02875 [Alphaproteobacteria bacterium]|nr:hypothetical protein [Alphaproteobacteria bacterium]